MTLIALTSQNRIEVTPHAGQCRRFLVYDVRDQTIGEPRWLELPAGQSLHDSHGDQPHPLDAMDWLISGSMGEGLRRRLAARGVRTRLTTERDPLRAVQRFIAGDLPDLGVPHDHGDAQAHGRAHEHRPGHGGCGGCGYHHPAEAGSPSRP